MLRLTAYLALAAHTLLSNSILAQGATERSPDDELEIDHFMLLEGFTVYGGEIKVINGVTGKEYTTSNPVVKEMHNAFGNTERPTTPPLYDSKTITSAFGKMTASNS